MKPRNLVTGAAAAAMMLLGAAGCMSDNSAGGDTTGGTTPVGTGGVSLPVATGGTSAPGTGGTGIIAGTGGTGTGGAGPRGSGGSPGTGGTAAGGRGPTGTGGAAPSGGTTGTGTAGAGGPSLCPVAGTTLCDGFEGTAPGAAGSDWTTMGTITVDATKAYRGTKSVKFVGSLAYIREKTTFTGTTKMTNNNLWVRYFFLSNQASVAAAAAGHVWYAALNSTVANAPDDFHPLGGSRGKLQAEIAINGDKYTDNRMPAAGTTSPDYPILSDGWQCWEFHVQSDDSFDFFMNGKEVPDMKIVAGKASKSGVSFSPMPTFGALSLGWQDFNGTTLTGWIDEVAVGPNQIGCGN